MEAIHLKLACDGPAGCPNHVAASRGIVTRTDFKCCLIRVEMGSLWDVIGPDTTTRVLPPF